ncbi:MAG: FeoA family protein [Elusimicrobiaceae bacterium]
MNKKTIPLSGLHSGASAVIHSVEGEGHVFARKLTVLGILPGKPVRKISGSAGGPIVFEIGGITLALGRNIAGRILVIPD